MREAASQHARAHAQLLGFIFSCGLSRHFSIHLIHRHFTVPDGKIMVYDTVKGFGHPDFLLCCPRDPWRVSNVRGLYFQASTSGIMAAYEYTTEAGEDMGAYADFVSQFAQAVLALGVQDVFALTAKSLQGVNFTEFEMSDILTTMLVSDCAWLPSDSKHSTPTDWNATPDYAIYADGTIPGIVSLKCTKTKAGKHYNFTCNRTRSGKHHEVEQPKTEANTAPTPAYGELLLDGQPLLKDSEPYVMISCARATVEAF